MPSWPTLSIEISFNSDSVKAFVQSNGVTAATWTPVTAYHLRFGYTRGRQRQLGRAEAGSGYIELDNTDGRFDPDNASSPYGADGAWARPGKHVRIRATWSGVTYNLFYGFTTAWELKGEGTSQPTVRVRLLDMIGWLARGAASINTATQLTGNAIRTILNSNLGVNSTLFNIDDGALLAYQITQSATPWSVIQQIADTEEGGICFVDGAGRFTYHDHTRRYARERSIVLQAIFGNKTEWQEAAVLPTLPFEAVTYAIDDTEFYTQAVITAALSGNPQTANTATLGGKYYVRTYSRSTHSSNDFVANQLAQRLAARFDAAWGDHNLGQHTDLTIEAGNDVAALWPKALGLEISDQIRVAESLWGGRERVIDSFIEGTSCDVDVANVSWKVTYRLSRVLKGFHTTILGKGTAFPT